MPDSDSELPKHEGVPEPPPASDTASQGLPDVQPGLAAGGARQPGTSFEIDFDLAGLMAGLGIDCGTAADQDAIAAAEEDALAHRRSEPVDVPGRVAALLPTGPALAAWLAPASTRDCGSGDLADIAAGYRRLAAWAQAGELATVAEMAARTAERRGRCDPSTGKPIQVLPEAGAQVGLALTMSQPSAMDWTSLASQLRWRLPATAAALAAGLIDLARARIIAQAVAGLDDKAARTVEAMVLPQAGEQTTGQLRAAVRRAVIAADPDGADQRRERAERHARVSLYADDDHTATLVGTGLSAVRAAAAFARITAMARALKAAGNPGGLDYLRAYVMLGLLLGTLPPGGPPTSPAEPAPREPAPREPAPREPEPPVDPPLPAEPADPSPEPPESRSADPGLGQPESRPADPDPGIEPDDEDDSVLPADLTPAWPPLPAGLAGTGTSRRDRPSRANGPPGEGLLDVLLPWSAYNGTSTEPAMLGRYGPVTPSQSSELLGLATRHRGTQWRIVLTDERGRARAVERFRLSRLARGDPLAGPLTSPVVGRLTVTIPDRMATPGAAPATGELVRDALVRAAVRASIRAAHADGSTSTSSSYRPSPRLREYVSARDITCTFPTCRQPAWRTDLDHTVPWHRGGATSSSNLGARCRTHHKIKQLSGWKLEQSPAGAFVWTTPAGNSYTTEPRCYPI